MAVKRAIPNKEGMYFITFTCSGWLNLIDITNSYDTIYKWFDYLKQHGHFIIAYQIMPNHVHAVIAFRNTGKNINTIIGDGKRFIAYEMAKRLKEMKQVDLLLQLSKRVSTSDKKKGKLHEVWEASFDWKDWWSQEIILQKLDYMHGNPCKGKWRLVENPVDYIHSSAKYYITGEQGIYPVTNYMELEDIDLTKEPPGPSRNSFQ